MFDSEYFRTALQSDVDSLGGQAVVTVNLASGRIHRVRSVLAIHNGYVTLEAYQHRGDEPTREPRWKETPAPGVPAHETQWAVVAYEGIADVTITPSRPDSAGGIGFVRP